MNELKDIEEEFNKLFTFTDGPSNEIYWWKEFASPRMILKFIKEKINQKLLEENKNWKKEIATYSFYSPEIFNKRIKELEK